jgi:hypothetical protein
MKDLLEQMTTHIDLAEAKSPCGFAWKKLLDAVVDDLRKVDAEVESEVAGSGNSLFGILARQNRLMSLLVMIVLISDQEK